MSESYVKPNEGQKIGETEVREEMDFVNRLLSHKRVYFQYSYYREGCASLDLVAIFDNDQITDSVSACGKNRELYYYLAGLRHALTLPAVERGKV